MALYTAVTVYYKRHQAHCLSSLDWQKAADFSSLVVGGDRVEWGALSREQEQAWLVAWVKGLLTPHSYSLLGVGV